MITREHRLKIAKLEETYGSNNGACFGTLNPSRLRPPFQEHLQLKKPNKGEEIVLFWKNPFKN